MELPRKNLSTIIKLCLLCAVFVADVCFPIIEASRSARAPTPPPTQPTTKAPSTTTPSTTTPPVPSQSLIGHNTSSSTPVSSTDLTSTIPPSQAVFSVGTDISLTRKCTTSSPLVVVKEPRMGGGMASGSLVAIIVVVIAVIVVTILILLCLVHKKRGSRDLDLVRRLAVRDRPLTEPRAVGRQPLEDVNSHIPARDRSMDSILQVLLFEDQASFVRGTALIEARDRPEVSVLIQETGYHNEETNQSHDGPQQLLSPNGQVSCTYAEYQTTATGAPRASERYHRPRRASPPNSDVGYPIQGASGQPQNQSMQPQNPVEHACTCPTCQSSTNFQRIY